MLRAPAAAWEVWGWQRAEGLCPHCPPAGLSRLSPVGIGARQLRTFPMLPLMGHGAAQILQPPPVGWEAWMGGGDGVKERGPGLGIS